MLSDSIRTALGAVEERLNKGEPITRLEAQTIASLMECWLDQALNLERNGGPFVRPPADNVVVIADFRGRT